MRFFPSPPSRLEVEHKQSVVAALAVVALELAVVGVAVELRVFERGSGIRKIN
jgi:hypothetical protein